MKPVSRPYVVKVFDPGHNTTMLQPFRTKARMAEYILLLIDWGWKFEWWKTPIDKKG